MFKKASVSIVVVMMMVMMLSTAAFAATKNVIPANAPMGNIRFGTVGHDALSDTTAHSNEWEAYLVNGKMYVSVEAVSIANANCLVAPSTVFMPVVTMNGETEGYKYDYNKQMASHYMIKPDGTIDTSEGNYYSYKESILKKGVNLYIPAASLLKAIGGGGEEFKMTYDKASRLVTITVPEWSNAAINLGVVPQPADSTTTGGSETPSDGEFNPYDQGAEGDIYWQMYQMYQNQ